MAEMIRGKRLTIKSTGGRFGPPKGVQLIEETGRDRPGTADPQIDENLFRWQTNLLPLMTRMVTGLALFFFLASFFQLAYLHWNIQQRPGMDIDSSLEGLVAHSGATVNEMVAVSRMKAEALLEANALERRYHQANVLLMSRIWISYLGFVTGMILALVGSSYILGKLREPVSEVESKSSLVSFSLRSASPGIILAVLGTILMLATIIVHHEIIVNDAPLYLREVYVLDSEQPKVDPVDRFHDESKDLVAPEESKQPPVDGMDPDPAEAKDAAGQDDRSP